MTEKRIFTDQELEEMGARTLDLLLAAIDAGDKEGAQALARRMQKEFQYLHDGYMFWVTGLQSYIYRKLGVDAVEEAEREAHTAEAKVVFTPPEKTDTRSLVEHLVGGLRGHMQPLTIVETETTVSVCMKPCGSGERLIQKGAYDPGIGLARIEEPHRITWGMEDFPIYCVHCPVMEALDVYKDSNGIPEEFYTRRGKKKP